MKRFLPVTIIGVFAAGLLLAGCSNGTEEKNAYVDTVNGIQTEMAQALGEATTATAESPEAAAGQLDNAAAIVGSALTDLRGVEVPEDAAAGHDDLLAAIGEAETVFSGSAAELRAVDDDDIEGLFEIQGNLTTAISEITPKIDEAINRINVDIGATGAG